MEYQQLIKIFIADGLLRSQYNSVVTSHEFLYWIRDSGALKNRLDNAFSFCPETELPSRGVYFALGETGNPWKIAHEEKMSKGIKKGQIWKWTSRF